MCVICECVFKSCLLNSTSSGLLVIPGVSTLPCLPLMLSLKTIIWSTSSSACSSSLPAVCTVTEDQTKTVSVVPSPRFDLFVFSSVLFVPVFCPSRQASPLAASPHARGSREFTPPFAALPSRGSRDFMPAVRGSLRRRSRLSHPAVRGTSCRRSRLSHPAVRGSWRRRSRLCHPAVRGSLRRRSRLSHPAVRGTSCRRSRLSDPAVRGSWRRRSRLCHPAVRGSSRRRLRIIQPSVPRRWRLHPRLTLARRPASDSMPAGLPLTQCPPACLWFQLARSAADSSSPDCRWLKLAGLPLTHATGRRQGRPTHHCLFHAVVRGPPLFHVLLLRGEGQPAVRGSLGPQPAEAPSSPPAPAVEWSSQPAAAVIVKPADHGIPSRPLPYWQASRPWP